jgi:cold shock CspA family protein
VSRSGAIKSWNADRGFGFIQPHDGGADVFVHISELPRGGSPPVVGEQVFFELGRGKDGRIQAVKVWRKGEDHSPRPAKSRRRSSRSRWGSGAVIVVVLGVVSLNAYQKRQQVTEATPRLTEMSPVETPKDATTFRCDGRTHCPQMTSCDEAMFFLRNCPGTKMDGDMDGIPCEDQWCQGLQ